MFIQRVKGRQEQFWTCVYGRYNQDNLHPHGALKGEWYKHVYQILFLIIT